jgi:hypothetical protein
VIKEKYDLDSTLKSSNFLRKKCMFYSFEFVDLDQLPLKNFLHMDTYKFDNVNQAMYCPVDIKVIIKSLK